MAKLRALGRADYVPAPVRADAPRRRTARRCTAPTWPTRRSGCSRSAPRPAASTRSPACSKRCRRSIHVPILVTQHLPAPFMAVLARQLATASGRIATVGEDGMVLLPDHIIIAPGDAHLNVDTSRDRLIVRLSNQKMSSCCVPSVDPMLSTAAAVLGPRALGVILSGMGRDGSEGASRLVAAGGSIIAQDEASSAVWGMPRAVVDAGLACAVLPPAKIARRIAARAEEALCR